MGVIKRQGIKSSLVSYIGVGIGIFSSIWIYPNFLKEYGLIQFFISFSTLVMPFASFGITSLPIRFFPKFEDKGKFLSLLLYLQVTVNIALGLFCYLFADYIIEVLENLNFETSRIKENGINIVILAFLIAFNNLIINFTSNYQRIVVPNLLNNLTQKIAFPLLLILGVSVFALDHVNTFLINGVIIAYALISISLIVYLRLLNKVDFKIQTPKVSKELKGNMFEYAFYGILTSLGTVLAFRIDSIMIPSLTDNVELGDQLNGIYNICLFLTNVILIPFNAAKGIMTPIFSNLINENNIEKIEELFQKGSLNLLIVGSLILSIIWVNVDNIFQLTSQKETLIVGKYCILYLGIAKVIEISLGLSGQIISMSKFFKINLIGLIALAVSNTLINYFLIPLYGINGAAFATFLSLLLFNLFRVIYLKYKLSIIPFNWKAIIVLLIGAITVIIAQMIPLIGISIIDIAISSSIITLLFTAGIYFTKTSKELNDVILKGINTIRKN